MRLYENNKEDSLRRPATVIGFELPKEVKILNNSCRAASLFQSRFVLKIVISSSIAASGLSAAEQLLLGHPFLAYPVGGLTEIVNDRCGKLCRSKKEMCAEIVRLLSDSAYYAAKSSYAPMAAARFADMKNYIENITSLYSALTKI